MNIPLDQVVEDGHNVRRVAASAADDARMRDSIATMGVLEPILVRADGERYVIIAGHRRVVAARALGHATIAAEVLTLTGADATAAQAAENAVRAAMHPVDQWRAIVQLQREGHPMAHAAACLGLTERQGRRLDRLGRLHPDVIDLIERTGLPDDSSLSTIANAPLKQQARAVKPYGKLESRLFNWWPVARDCAVERFARGAAIFDTAKMAWDEDLFAEPGSDAQFTTSDLDRFRALQTEAMDGVVADYIARKQRARIVAWGGVEPALPKGWVRGMGDPLRPKRTETVFIALASDGGVHRVTGIDAAAEKQRLAAREDAAKAKARAATSDDGDDGSDGDDDDDAAEDGGADDAAEAAVRPTIDKTGQAMIAEAKTAALRTHLAWIAGDATALEMLRLMILMLAADNVQLGYDIGCADLAAQLLLPGGGPAPPDDRLTCRLAGEALCRILCVGTHRPSGNAAEWIGMAIGADAALARFDTAEFLQHVAGDELKRIAEQAGVQASGTVAKRRQTLIGALPTWRPAVFGAPAPPLAERPATIHRDAADAVQ